VAIRNSTPETELPKHDIDKKKVGVFGVRLMYCLTWQDYRILRCWELNFGTKQLETKWELLTLQL